VIGWASKRCRIAQPRQRRRASAASARVSASGARDSPEVRGELHVAWTVLLFARRRSASFSISRTAKPCERGSRARNIVSSMHQHERRVARDHVAEVGLLSTPESSPTAVARAQHRGPALAPIVQVDVQLALQIRESRCWSAGVRAGRPVELAAAGSARRSRRAARAIRANKSSVAACRAVERDRSACAARSPLVAAQVSAAPFGRLSSARLRTTPSDLARKVSTVLAKLGTSLPLSLVDGDGGHQRVLCASCRSGSAEDRRPETPPA